MRIPYSTDIDTAFGQYADIECVLSVSDDNRGDWEIDGIYVRQGFGKHVQVSVVGPELSNHLAYAIFRKAEAELATHGSKLRTRVEEAVNYGEAA